MTIFKRLTILWMSLHVPASAAGVGLMTTGCGCDECCSCEYACSGSGFSSEGSATTKSDGGCLDCDEACADAARQGGCGEDDVTSAEACG